MNYDIMWRPCSVPLSLIEPTGYDHGVNHRIIRQGHLNKLKNSFNEQAYNNYRFPVIWDSATEKCVLIDGQHLFVVALELMEEGSLPRKKKIPCDMAFRKCMDEKMDCQNELDVLEMRKYSLRSNSGSEGVCSIDMINETYKSGMDFIKNRNINRNNPKEMTKTYDYLTSTIFNSKGELLCLETIKKYFRLGEKIEEQDAWIQLQEQRLSIRGIEAFLKRNEVVDPLEIHEVIYKTIQFKRNINHPGHLSNMRNQKNPKYWERFNRMVHDGCLLMKKDEDLDEDNISNPEQT